MALSSIPLLTSIPGKVMEIMFLYRMLNWIMTHSILNERHFGFLPNSDSCKALCVFYQDIRQARSQSEFVCAVKLDIMINRLERCPPLQNGYDRNWWKRGPLDQELT